MENILSEIESECGSPVVKASDFESNGPGFDPHRWHLGGPPWPSG